MNNSIYGSGNQSILRKRMHTINADVVQGHSYEIFQHKNLSYKSFVTQNFQIYGMWSQSEVPKKVQKATPTVWTC